MLALDPADPHQWFSVSQGQDPGSMAVFGAADAYSRLGLLDDLEHIAIALLETSKQKIGCANPG